MLDDDKLAKAGNDTATPEPKAPKAPPIDKDANKAERADAELNAALSKAFRKAEERGQNEDDGDDEPAPRAKAKAAPKKAAGDEEAAARNRGPDGRFEGKDGDKTKKAVESSDEVEGKERSPKSVKESEAAESEDDSADEKASKPIQAKERRAESSEEDDSDESEAPESWRGKSVWKGMSREARQHAAARETAHTETAKKLEAYNPVGLILNSHQATFARHGVAFDRGLAMVLRAQDALDQNPGEAIKKIAESYGVDLRQLVGATQQHDPAAEIDDAFDSPAVTEMRRELAELKAERAAEKQQREAWARQQQQAQKQTNMQVVDAFIAKADKYPHAGEVGQDIIDALPSVMRANPGLQGEALLAKAYEKAIRLNEKVWAKVQAAEKAAQEAERRERDAAKKAKDADALNVGDEAADQVRESDEDSELRGAYRRSKRREERRAA
jgi:hypothetical protein